MKKIGNWWLPDDENFEKITKTVKKQEWSCLEPLAYAMQYVEKFNLAIDIGTWIGDSTVTMSGGFNNVVGFEANPEVYECCVRNIKDRKLQNVDVFNYALTNKPQLCNFMNRNSSFSGWVDTVGVDELAANEKKQEVVGIPLDSFHFENVDFLKIDVDSHEGFVLSGAYNFFNNNSPVILIEHKPTVLNRQTEDMPVAFELLESFGYRMQQQVGKIDFIWTRN